MICCPLPKLSFSLCQKNIKSQIVIYQMFSTVRYKAILDISYDMLEPHRIVDGYIAIWRGFYLHS